MITIYLTYYLRSEYLIINELDRSVSLQLPRKVCFQQTLLHAPINGCRQLMAGSDSCYHSFITKYCIGVGI